MAPGNLLVDKGQVIISLAPQAPLVTRWKMLVFQLITKDNALLISWTQINSRGFCVN